MFWQELILTVAFTVIMNAVIEYLETMPRYSCPVYCEVNHEHYKEVDEEFKYIETYQIFRDDSTSTYRLVQEHKRVGQESKDFREQKGE